MELAIAKRTTTKTFPLGRDSKTGKFIPVSEAKRRPATTTVERVPKVERGDVRRDNKTGQYVEERHRVSGASVNSISKTTKKRSATLKNLATR